MVLEPQQEKNYFSLLESSQRLQYPGFVDYLCSQCGPTAEAGRAAVIEFQDGAKPLVKRINTSRALRRYLAQTPPNGAVLRRAFVLEGLPKDFLLVLGSNLRVPPSFFATHWAGPGTYMGNLVGRTPRHYDNKDRFILSFQRVHRARIKEMESDELTRIYHEVSDLDRPISHITLFGDFEGPLSSFEQFSFWSTREGQAWDGKYL